MKQSVSFLVQKTIRGLLTVVTALFAARTGLLAADAPPKQEVQYLHAGRMLDVRTGEIKTDIMIRVDAGKIAAISSGSTPPAGTNVIDLSKYLVLPGLIDNHTHVLLQGDPTAVEYDEQLLKESTPYRTIRATVAARTALEHGFTTIRDLETEGAMYADVDLKRAINAGIIPGPRMVVVTRALAPTGAYPLSGYSWEIQVPHGVQVVDGADAIRKAVREQVSFGADWIKYYSDRAYQVKDGVLHSRANFTDEEARALVDESHRQGRKVAAHAMGYEGIDSALRAGVDTIEHGDGITEALAARIVQQGVYWCPTIYIGAAVAEPRAAAGSPVWKEMVDISRKAFSTAIKAGVKISFGTDAGGFPWTVSQHEEFPYMVKYGMTPLQAIQSATITAAALLDKQDEFGVIEVGKFADIIAVQGDPLADITNLKNVKFVMKEGVVYKQ